MTYLRIYFYICLITKSLPMNIGTKLKSLRIEKGIEPQDMALKLAISETTYRRYERNEAVPDINMLEKIALVLDKTFFDLLPDTILFTNNDQKGGIALAYQSTINQQNEKLIELLEKSISEKDEVINELRETLTDLKRKN